MSREGNPADSLEQLQYKITQLMAQADPRMIKQFYKHELDALVNEKQKQKQLEKEKSTQEKKAYNERLEHLKEMEKLKEISYKNVSFALKKYYQMLMTGQQQHQSNYISPYSKRDNLIDAHINTQLTEGHLKAQHEQQERLKKISTMKDDYKHELMHQLEEKMQLRNNEKAQRERQRQHYGRYAKLPMEIDEFERVRRREQMAKYKEDLDKNIVDKEQITKRRNSQSSTILTNKHNPLYNPIPFNVQNPYILKQMERSNSGLIRNGSYLANIGNNNIANP